MKPGARQFQIECASDKANEPDFVVGTEDQKPIVEIKAAKEMSDPMAKARAAFTAFLDKRR